MLKIWFYNDYWDLEESLRNRVVRNVSDWFDFNYEDSWLEDDNVKAMVKDVDLSELNGLNVISPVLGSISIRDLSAGVKTLISIYKNGNTDNLVFSTSSCGDNCVKWLQWIGEQMDVEVGFAVIHGPFVDPFRFICMNNGKEYSTYDMYRHCAYRIKLEGRMPKY